MLYIDAKNAIDEATRLAEEGPLNDRGRATQRSRFIEPREGP